MPPNVTPLIVMSYRSPIMSGTYRNSTSRVSLFQRILPASPTGGGTGCTYSGKQTAAVSRTTVSYGASGATVSVAVPSDDYFSVIPTADACPYMKRAGPAVSPS